MEKVFIGAKALNAEELVGVAAKQRLVVLDATAATKVRVH
jgi:hypothetical protein